MTQTANLASDSLTNPVLQLTVCSAGQEASCELGLAPGPGPWDCSLASDRDGLELLLAFVLGAVRFQIAKKLDWWAEWKFPH